MHEQAYELQRRKRKTLWEQFLEFLNSLEGFLRWLGELLLTLGWLFIKVADFLAVLLGRDWREQYG